jgi:hypothetical protein
MALISLGPSCGAPTCRAGLRTLYEANRTLVTPDPQDGTAQQYTLLDILPLFTSESFCPALLQDVQDAWLHRWWRSYFEPLCYTSHSLLTKTIASLD